MLRKIVLHIHRYAGLGMALFLVLTGLTGAILVWEEELDAALNPELLTNQAPPPALTNAELIERFNDQHNLEFSFMVLPKAPERSAIFYVSNATLNGEPINQILLDRNSGNVLGARNNFESDPLKRSEVIPWLYRFHYSLSAGGIGSLLLGIVALVWLLDTLIAWYLTLPRRFSWSGWRPAWAISSTRRQFDSHRAGGLWFTPVFLGLALTGVYFNLYDEVFLPVTNAISKVTPQPYQRPVPPELPPPPDINHTQAIELAQQQLEDAGVRVHALDFIGYSYALGHYSIAFYTELDISRDAPSANVYIKGNGEVDAVRIYGEGTAADTFIDWQFPLHSGQAFGLFGRIVLSISGIVLAVLSVTGILIWRRKWAARSFSSTR